VTGGNKISTICGTIEHLTQTLLEKQQFSYNTTAFRRIALLLLAEQQLKPKDRLEMCGEPATGGYNEVDYTAYPVKFGRWA